MENLYNAVLSFKGDGNFTFSLPSYGELTVYAGRDIYVKGLSVSGVEALRQLKPLLLEHKLNGKPDGCFRVIDLTTLNNTPSKVLNRPLANPIQEIKSVADLKAEMIKSNGPIVDDKEDNKEDVTENDIAEEDTTEEDTTDNDATEEDIVDEVKEDAIKTTAKKSSKTTRRGASKKTVKKQPKKSK